MALSDLLGIELVESTPDKYVTRMLVTENMLQPHGVLHGGISAALAENAASQCCTDHYDNDKMFFLGVEVSSTHLLPGRYGKNGGDAHSRWRSHFPMEGRAIPRVRWRIVQCFPDDYVWQEEIVYLSNVFSPRYVR